MKMKATLVLALTFAVLLSAVYAKDFKVKVKNTILDKDEDDDINVDESKGTETVSSSGHLSMKDFTTGYTAIKNTEKKECLIIKNNNPDEQKSVADLEKDLEAIEGSKKVPEVVQEAVEEVPETKEITDEQRNEVGQNLIDFCGDFNILIGTTEEDAQQDKVQEGEAEEVEEKEDKKPNNQVQSRKKRSLCLRRRLYVQRVCIRQLYRRTYRYCCSTSWYGCRRYCYRYSYFYKYSCYTRYFYKYVLVYC